MSAPTADVSVRLAWHADAAAIAAVQVDHWRTAYATVLPADVLASLPVEDIRAQWEQSIDRPRDARQRVLVALDRAAVRGFTTCSPTTDPDSDPGSVAEVGEVVVDPAARGAGHGSRLLHAAVDTLRSDGFTTATLWVTSTNDDVRRFLVDQGWSPDGAYRELDLDGDGRVTVRQVRLHTDLTPD